MLKETEEGTNKNKALTCYEAKRQRRKELLVEFYMVRIAIKNVRMRGEDSAAKTRGS